MPGKPLVRLQRYSEPATRTPTARLTAALDSVVRLDLPPGSFNAGLAELPGQPGFVLAYRSDEYHFRACLLSPDLKIRAHTDVELAAANCADPRLAWNDDYSKLYLVYSSHNLKVKPPIECIRAEVIMLPKVHGLEFIPTSICGQVSPAELPGRQKNWMPFCHEGKMYLIASSCPHTIYEMLDNDGELSAVKRYETQWHNPWFNSEFLRGSTNAVRLDDGTYLGTFHTATRVAHTMFYDNGCYVFEGKPPFKVLRCGNRTFLPAECATEPYFRNQGRIKVCFPVGMVRDGEKIYVSYGDNDSAVKIAKTTVEHMLATTVPVYQY